MYRKVLARAPAAGEAQGRAVLSYQWAVGKKARTRWLNFSWATWLIFVLTVGIWCVTAYRVALAARARTFQDILASILANSEDSQVLLAFGAKDDVAILHGQYWRLVTPLFLHANILHLGLNMLNFLLLGLITERIFGHLRFGLIYLLAGVVSILASFIGVPQDISVGASGAIFGLVGAYSAFLLLHRRAFRYHGIIAFGWLLLVIGINLGLGFVLPDVDNYAHVGGLLSGCLLGWSFAPFYHMIPRDGGVLLVNARGLARHWLPAFLLIVLTIVSAIIAIHFVGG